MQDNRKLKTIESIWQEAQVSVNQEMFTGYVLAHLEQLHLGLRNVVCFTTNIFGDNGLNLVLKWCIAFNCRIAYIAEGFNGVKDELWVVNKNDNRIFNYIPSRLSENPEDHIFRGRLLEYRDKTIESYFE